MASFRFLFSVLLLIAVLLHPLHVHSADIAHDKSSDGRSELRETETNKTGWKLIKNETYGFSLRVPAAAHVKGQYVSNDSESIRIQNYQSSGSPDLRADAFWLEVFIFDHKAKRKIWEPCEALIPNSTTETKNGVKVLTGNPKNVSPDAGGYVQSLCAEVGPFDVYLQAAENKKDTPILKTIYGSFRITSRFEKR
jgi:hypothetical protein